MAQEEFDFGFNEPEEEAQVQSDGDGAPRDHRRDPILYKKYFKSRSAEGFLTIKPWFEALKVSIDIGAVRNGQLASSTLAYMNAIELATYLQAVVNNNAERLYPSNERAGLPTNEGLIVYGGGQADGKTVARIIKIHRWTTSDNQEGDPNFFAWKAGSFVGRRTGTGAVTPDMSQPITQDLIKISRREMAEISYRLNLALSGHVARVGEQLWIKK